MMPSVIDETRCLSFAVRVKQLERKLGTCGQTGLGTQSRSVQTELDIIPGLVGGNDLDTVDTTLRKQRR